MCMDVCCSNTRDAHGIGTVLVQLYTRTLTREQHKALATVAINTCVFCVTKSIQNLFCKKKQQQLPFKTSVQHSSKGGWLSFLQRGFEAINVLCTLFHRSRWLPDARGKRVYGAVGSPQNHTYFLAVLARRLMVSTFLRLLQPCPPEGRARSGLALPSLQVVSATHMQTS